MHRNCNLINADSGTGRILGGTGPLQVVCLRIDEGFGEVIMEGLRKDWRDKSDNVEMMVMLDDDFTNRK